MPGFTDVLGLGAARHAVICLVDGLGDRLLARNADLAPTLAGLTGAAITAPFPTTTPVGLGSLGTGLLPGTHGLVGASFLLPEIGAVLQPLHWGTDPSPLAVQPEPTVFERAARAGMRTTAAGPAAYAGSGLTRAALRGMDYRGCETAAERAEVVRAVTAATDPSLTYVYWAELDRTGHEFGVDSAEWRSALVRVDQLVARVLESLGGGAVLIVTADHGMVDGTDRIAVDADPSLTDGVAHVAGEPRARHVYTHEGAQGEVLAAWRERLAGRADVLSRADIVASGLVGDVDPALEERIGDVVAIARGGTCLTTRADALVSSLIGQHGALTDDERAIPALVFRADD